MSPRSDGLVIDAALMRCFDHRLLDVQGGSRRGIGGFTRSIRRELKAWEGRRGAGAVACNLIARQPELSKK